MNNPDFSFIILTYNEERHLPRLLHSIAVLNAATYVLDSGSTDETLNICKKHNITVKYHAFKNHPTQWDAALKIFEIKTPWVIGLDADHIVTPGLCRLLENFKDEAYVNTDGIYFNRKNYFKGRWIKHGGYYPKYLLKMFRYPVGYSDLTENMDHRFQVPGDTLIWKNGHLIEENLKEDKISFWIDKHNRYSDLLAEEGIQRLKSSPVVSASLWGSPNQRNAWLKKLWWQLPKYLRPFLYFFYRMVFRLGILDGRTGIIYHFLQAFWFRLIVDIKIDELGGYKPKSPARRFVIIFLTLFCIFYGINLACIAITTPGGIYIPFADRHLNYIRYWRQFCISSSAHALKFMGYQVLTSSTGLTAKAHAGFRLVYSCLGYGVMCCFAAFVMAFPKPIPAKMAFLIAGLMSIQLLNTLRFILITIYYHPKTGILSNNPLFYIDHHDIFNLSLYTILCFITYLWINYTPVSSKKTSIKKTLN